MKFKRRFYRKFKYNKKRSFMFIFFFLVCLSFGLGYSLISTDINIFGTTVLKDNRWDVHFDNIVELDDSVSPTVEPEITNGTTVSFSAKLENPGDKYEFLIDVVNAGTIDAKFVNLTMNPILTTEQQQFFSYEVTYESGVTLNANQALNAGTSETLKVSFKYLEQEDDSLYPMSDQSFNVVLMGEYVQGTGTPVDHPYLYNVLMKEAENNGIAKEYTGDHQDSMDVLQSTKKIYHWYATNNSEGTQIRDKNNVIFAGHCWQTVRTTDTGGVKMMYNGEVENGQCLDTRGNHVGYVSWVSQNLNGNYWYGTDYTYDSTNKVFSLSGITEQVRWNATTGPNLIDKYTCKSTAESATCSTLYLVESYNTASSAYVMSLNSNSSYSQFGTLPFNASHGSPTYVGYKYGDVYSSTATGATISQNLTTRQDVYQYNWLYNFYWYADSISYDSTTGMYSLVNPYQVSSTSDYPNLVGKYTFRNSYQLYTENSVYYIAAVKNDIMYYQTIQSGNLLSAYEPIIFGDSVSDNGNGTYTINNPTNVTLTDWYTNYASYNNKYTCNDTGVTCANPRYTTSTASTNYYYIKVNEKIMIGKNRSGTTLTDTSLVRKDELVINSSNYSDYKYTCDTGSATCTEETLRMITGFNTEGYIYVPNRYFGSSVTWDGTNYTLQNTIEMENYDNMSDISTHHFMCVSPGLKTCDTVAFVYSYSNIGTKSYRYITLREGITTVSKALEDMFTKNTTDSIIKNGVDAWYKHYLLENYDSYIEDTIFCNDRSVQSARNLGGWNDSGGTVNGNGLSANLNFKENTRTTDLSCTNNTDKFSISNNDALLDYKVGLISSPEIYIFNNLDACTSGGAYWFGTPSHFRIDSYGYVLSESGSYFSNHNDVAYGVRPVISLKPKTKYLSGTGSMDDPYVITE